MNNAHAEVNTHAVAVLAGGSSSRMGFDKAQARFGSQTLLDRTIGTAAATNPAVIYVCGGSVHATTGLEVEHLIDAAPNEGPLVGLLAAIDAAPGERLVCIAVDLPLLSAATILEVLSVLDTAEVAVPVTAGRRQWHLSGWRVDRCRERLWSAFEAGARSFQQATEDLEVGEMVPNSPVELVDVDTPGMLREAGGRPPLRRGLS
ncbi:MAG: molybdenum cofactor guanylyltransferase [Acidobacteria bacterium]|nr:molybdenum cofactor guanylyltransferase [Acidobacteriota bacterium]